MVFSVLFYVFEILLDFLNEIFVERKEIEAQRNCDMTKFTYLVHGRADVLDSWTGFSDHHIVLSHHVIIGLPNGEDDCQ